MSEQIKETIRIDTIDNASATLKKIEDGLKRLKAQADKTFGNFRMPGLDRMVRRTNQAAAAARMTDADTKALRSKIVGETKVARLREKTVAAENKARVSAERADAAALKTKIVGMAKVARLREQFQQEEARAKAAAEKAEMRAIRERVAFGARMARQRAGEERADARDEAASVREGIRLDRFRMRLRETYERSQAREAKRDQDSVVRHGRDGSRHASDAFVRSTRGAAAAGVVGAAGAGLALRRTLGVEADVDSAEIGTRQYGGLNKKQARDLRDRWAAPLSEQLGVSTSKLLTSWTDAVKLGIPVAGAKQFAGLATQTSEAWGRPFEEVSDILGTINTIITSSGEVFSFDKLKGVANTLQHLAAKQSTTPEKLISYLQRGAGGAQVLGMSQNAGLAFGSASTSLGNQAGESGRLVDYMAGRLVELPRLVKKKGHEGQDARELVQALGYGSAASLDAKRRENPDDFLPDFMDRFAKISDPKKQERALRFFAGREWFGELGRMVKGNSTYQEAAKLAKESKNLDAIGEVWELHKQKLVFVGKQFSSGWENILGEFGKELSPLARQAGDYFLEWSAKLRQGGLSQRFRAAITGFIEGLGFKDLPDLLKGMFGAPGEGNAGSIQAWGDAARGFGQGLRDVGSTIASFFNVFTGGNATPEVIGKWTGRVLAFSLACVFAAPVIGILGSIGGALAGFTLAAAGAWRVLKGLGLVGGAAAGAAGAAGATAGSAVKGAKGGWLGRLFGSRAGLGVAGAAAGGAMLGMSQEESDALMLRLGKYARERNGTAPDQKPVPTDPTTGMTDELRALREALDGNAKVLKQSFEGGSSGTVPRLHKASFGPDESGEFKRSLAVLGAKIELAALGGSERPRLIGRRGVPETIAPPPPSLPSPPRVFGSVPGVLFGRPGAAIDRFGMSDRRGILGGGRIDSGSGGASGLSGEARERAMSYYAGLRQGGLSAVQANALMGHATQETGGSFSGSSWNAREGAGGMLQYRGNRLANLKQFAASIGKPWTDPHTQGLFASKEREIDPYERKRSAGFFGATDLATATREAGRNVVRFGDNTGPYRERMARAFADGSAYDGLHGGADAGAITGKPTSQFNHMRGQYGPPGSNLVKVMTPGGKAAWVHKEAAPSFQRFVNDLEATGYKIGSFGGHAHRSIRGSSRLSQHAFGNAIDINPATNPMGPNLVTDMPKNIREMAAKHGLSWGGDFKRRPDAMHFEWTGKRPWEDGAGTLAEESKKAIPTPESLASSVTGGAARRPGDTMMGRGGGGNSIHAPITIQGGNSDPETLAQLVQKRLSETGRTRQHDLDYQSI